MLIKDETSFELLKKTLDEAHSEVKNLDLEIEGCHLRRECYYKSAVKYYCYYSMPFDVDNLDNTKCVVKKSDLINIFSHDLENHKEQGKLLNLDVVGSQVRVKRRNEINGKEFISYYNFNFDEDTRNEKPFIFVRCEEKVPSKLSRIRDSLIMIFILAIFIIILIKL